MSRAAVPGLPSRHPIGELLPMLYAEDDLAQRFTAGLDTVLAPVFATLDNLPAYFEPRLAPTDFVAWLAGWVGMENAVHTAPASDAPGATGGPGAAGAFGVAGPASEEVHRAVVARAVELHRWRGTRRGLQERLALSLGAGAEVVDGGGVSWSTTPGTPLPPSPGGELLVRVWPLEPRGSRESGEAQQPHAGAAQGRAPEVDEAQVREIVEASCPVHLTWRVEILPGPPAREES